MPATILTNPKLWAWLAIAALRDWNLLLERVDALLPRQAHGRVVTVGREIDAVLAEWLRGQLLVVAVMSIYYGSGRRSDWARCSKAW